VIDADIAGTPWQSPEFHEALPATPDIVGSSMT